MNWLILPIAFILSSFSSMANVPEQESNCWDGSFAYRVASLKVEGERVEIGATAQFMLMSEVHDDGVSDISGMPIGASFGSETVYAAFNASQCTQDINNTIVCEAFGRSHDWRLKDNLFIQRYLVDLDNRVAAITPISVESIKAVITDDEFRLELFEKKQSAVERVAVIQIPKDYCDSEGHVGGTFFGNAFFPERLRDYLSGRTQNLAL